MNTRTLVLLLLLALVSISQAHAKEVPPRPNKLVNDYAQLLDPEQEAALERKLVAYADSTSTQIAIVLDQSLEGDDVFEYSFRIAESWGIGTKENDNGILIYAALEDRKLYIHSGMGVQDYLTDNVAKRLLDQVLRPAFRQQNYYGGLDQITTILIDLGAGKYTNDNPKASGDGRISPFVVLLIIFAVIFLFGFLGNSGGRGGGYHRGGHYDSRGGGGWIFFPGGGFGGGGNSNWGNDDGGGFGGFDGGGFDGGGAGGDW